MLRYPMNMSVAGRQVVVVGGGRVAGRKLRLLEGTGAALRIVAAAPSDEVRAWAALGADLVEAPFELHHLDGAFAAIAATDSRDTNAAVVSAAKARGVLVNVADDPDASDFHVPAVLRRGRLTVALSTGGACPGFSHALKEWLGGLIGPEVATALEVVAAARERLRQDGPPPRQAYERLVGDALFEACRRRDEAALDRLLADTLGPAVTAASLGVTSLLDGGSP